MLDLLIWSVICFTALLVGLALLLTIAERLLVNYGICNIDINAGGKLMDVDGGQTLLSALYENEVYIPSACGGQGTCGYCKVTALSGVGQVLVTETPFLTRRERTDGVRLACQVKVRENIALKIPEELLNVRMYQASIASTRDLTYDMKEILIALPDEDEISARPGQYIQIQAPSPDGPVFRAYSISSPASEKKHVELNVRILPDGAGVVPGGIGPSYLHSLGVDDPVIFTGPYGEFVLDEDPDTEIVCVGGGAGMAPIKNIVYSICDQWPDRACWLFFGCRTTRDIFYLDEFKALAQKHPNLHIVYALSDELGPDEQWDGERGFIHLSLDKCLQPGVKRQAFLCGPPPMIEAVTRVLEEKGLTEKDIFYDEF